MALPRVVRTRKRRNEDGHDLVADELVDDRIVPDQQLGGRAVEAVEQRPKLGRTHRLR
jgi:hypothetical protein